MPDTKPGLVINKQGKCQACINYDKRSFVDWDKRYGELKEVVKRYKRNDGYYDCIIAVSGGKDSHYQTYIMKEVLGMNPLLVRVNDPFTKTKAGIHNAHNIQKAFNCHTISLNIDPDLVKRMVRIAFKEFGSPTWAIDRAIYVFPIRMAVSMNIPLVVYGENVSWEYGGVLEEDTYSAKEQINNDVAKKVDWNIWYDNGISREEMNPFIYPADDKIEKSKLDPIFLSYFIPWDGYKNYQIAKKYGFRDIGHEWNRDGYIEHYGQIDTVGYLMNVWLKYPKFGFAATTDTVGYWRRSGQISRKAGVKLIKEHDHKLDQKVLDDFLDFTGLTDKQFWETVEKFWNTDLFEKENGFWIKKNNLWEQDYIRKVLE